MTPPSPASRAPDLPAAIPGGLDRECPARHGTGRPAPAPPQPLRLGGVPGQTRPSCPFRVSLVAGLSLQLVHAPHGRAGSCSLETAIPAVTAQRCASLVLPSAAAPPPCCTPGTLHCTLRTLHCHCTSVQPPAPVTAALAPHCTPTAPFQCTPHCNPLPLSLHPVAHFVETPGSQYLTFSTSFCTLSTPLGRTPLCPTCTSAAIPYIPDLQPSGQPPLPIPSPCCNTTLPSQSTPHCPSPPARDLHGKGTACPTAPALQS